MHRIFTLGETTYDIIFKNNQPQKGIIGGSNLNTAISLGRLGLPAFLISRVGNDTIGRLTTDFLKNNGVSTQFITTFTGNSRLSLAFLDKENNANYQFYKAIYPSAFEYPEIKATDLVSFGSSNAFDVNGREDFVAFLKDCTQKEAITVYDPNIRTRTPEEFLEKKPFFEENLNYTSILKGSDKDFINIYKTSNPDDIYNHVKPFGIKTLIITSGNKPVELRSEKVRLSVDIENIEPVSTIGAGDNFTAGLLFGLYKQDVRLSQLVEITEIKWLEIIKTANHFAQEVCLRYENYISPEFALSVKA